ncbi:MAG: hypothetical protein M1832_004533 [Thelocarpon impressellum]|nr:MAG: hypothetical protein M1832_004533 [Thelocarpon impressellum]
MLESLPTALPTSVPAATLALAAVALGLVVFVVQSVRSYLRLRHIQGPLLASWSQAWIVKGTLGGRMHLDLLEASEKYGALARIGPNNILTHDPDIIRRMSAVRSPYIKSDWWDGMKLDPGQDNILSQQDEAKHSALRMKMAAGYAGKENPKLEESIDNRIQDLISLIEREYLSTGTNLRKMDFGRVAQYLTLDVISDVAFGKPFGDLVKNRDEHAYIEVMEQTLPAIILVSNMPGLRSIMKLNWVANMLAPTAKDKKGLGKVMGVAKAAAAERFGPKKVEKEDMLGSFVRHGLTFQEAQSESFIQILAGSDTTATALRATFLFIVTNPSIYAALRAEVDRADREGRLSKPIVREAEARELPYLQACIKEGLRMWPPITGIMEKQVPPEGDVLDGRFIPGGTRVGTCAWGLQRRKDVYGEDANLFRPERWFEADAATLVRMGKVHAMVFGSGRYSCLGKTIAWIELNKVFVELLRRFDFSVVDPTKPWNSWCAGIFLQSQFFLRVSRRKTETEKEPAVGVKAVPA